MIKDKAIENMSFESALAELEEIVRKIDTGQEDLANAVESFERGILLKKHCENMLKATKMKIEKITGATENEITTVEVDL